MSTVRVQQLPSTTSSRLPGQDADKLVGWSVQPCKVSQIGEEDELISLLGDESRENFFHFQSEKLGWNPEISQGISAKANGRWYNRQLSPLNEDGVGHVFHQKVNANGRIVWENGSPAFDLDSPKATFTFDPCVPGEVGLRRFRKYCTIHKDGEDLEVDQGHVTTDIDQDGVILGHFIRASLVDPEDGASEPWVKIPVDVEIVHFKEPSQVVEVEGRYFAHRNLQGMVHIKGTSSSVSYPVMNVNPDKVSLHRSLHDRKMEAWKALSTEERAASFKDKNLNPGFKAHMESYFVKDVFDQTVLIEVQKNEDGSYFQPEEVKSQPEEVKS